MAACSGIPEDRRLLSVTDAAGGLKGVDQLDGPDRSWAYNAQQLCLAPDHGDVISAPTDDGL
jgi:hypothetical protein